MLDHASNRHSALRALGGFPPNPAASRSLTLDDTQLLEREGDNSEKPTEQTSLIVADVLLPLRFAHPFTYIVPEDMPLEKGTLVRVPFGKREEVGIVWNAPRELRAEEDTTKLRQIQKPLSHIPPFKDSLLQLIAWVADYTMNPLGNVLALTMSVPDLHLLPQYPTRYCLTDRSFKLTPARQKLIELMSDNVARTIEDIAKQANISRSVVEGVREQGALIALEEQPSWKQSAIPLVSEATTLHTLTPEQQAAADDLIKSLHSREFSVNLLDGVTGSGKTEVYFALIEYILKQPSGQALILLPEIVLTAQVVRRIRERFGIEPTIWHSSMNDRTRKENWLKVACGTARLVVGARSALFLPFQDLRLTVIDEEHDASYKQEEGVIYHARDMAAVRARLESATVVLASATPSLETYANTVQGKYREYTLTSRFGSAGFPHIGVIDMRTQTLDRGTWISQPLRQEIFRTLERNEQALLYLNRRGFAPLTLCKDCGHHLTCPDCTGWLVAHRGGQILRCHHCGYHSDFPKQCPSCHTNEESLVLCGPGVERVADEVHSLFPTARIAMMTSDNVSDGNKAEQVVGSITRGEVDIVIGTQMVVKGHHFPKLSLVGVIDADAGLAGGELRAAERTYQLLHQVAGRAGRESTKGTVLMQSYQPNNAIIEAMVSGDRDRFLQAELESRERMMMPPFSRLAAIVISGLNDREAADAATHLVRFSPQVEGVRVLGPTPAPLFLLRKRYRYRILVKAEKNIKIQKLITEWLRNTPISRQIHLKVDIDPYSFF